MNSQLDVTDEEENPCTREINEIVFEMNKNYMEVQENEDKYVCGELELVDQLKETEERFQRLTTEERIKGVRPSKILPDSKLVSKLSHIVKEKVKCMQPSTQVFEPVDFSRRLHLHLNQESSVSSTDQSTPWMRLGEMVKNKICSPPSFHYIHGAFEPGHVELKKRTRRTREKDVIGEEVRPQSKNLDEAENDKDVSTEEIKRIMGILSGFRGKPVSYFQFVVNPKSFSRTVENMFHVSYLVKEGYVRIDNDNHNLPVISKVSEEERNRDEKNVKRNQTVISINMEDWRELIDAFEIRSSIL